MFTALFTKNKLIENLFEIHLYRFFGTFTDAYVARRYRDKWAVM